MERSRKLISRAGPLKLFLGARDQFAGSDNHFFSPSGGFVRVGALRARGSVFRGFRAANAK